MAGTVLTERVAGIASGFPAEMDGSLKVRFVAPLLVNMSETSCEFLKYIGGPESFSFDATKVEWTEEDAWNRRLTQGGLTDGTTTSLTVTAAAHRYPIGTILYNVPDGEYVRVTGHIDANTLQIARDITADVSEGAWGSTDEVLVVGLSMHENDDYVFRPTAIMSQPYNVPQVYQSGVQADWRRTSIRLYGQLNGNDLERQSAKLVEEMFVDFEGGSIMGRRLDGTSSVPSMHGGVKFYVTSANGAQVTNLSSAPFTRADIDGMLQNLFYTVGREKMAMTLLCGSWAQRKVTSFFQGAVRLQDGVSEAGMSIQKFRTDFGVVDVMMHTAVVQNEMYLINKDSITMGHLGEYGRPQLRELPPSTVGPRIQKVFYADVSMMVSGVQAMGKIYGFSTTA